MYIEGRAHYSFLIPHHREMWALTNGFFPVWEFSLVKQTWGKSACQYYRGYPQLRLTYIYSDFGMSKQLGVMHAVIPNIRLPLIRGKNMSLMFGFGLGAAYLSKTFNREYNYQNLAIGSHYNAAIQFALSWRIKMDNRIYFNSGVSMMHISNGTIRSPNYGLNIPGLFAGLSWKLTGKEIKYKEPEDLRRNKGRITVRLMGLAARKQILSQPEKEFGVLAGSISFSTFYNQVNTFLVGVDLIYDESTKYLLEQDEKPADDWEDVTKIGASVGHEWTFSDLSVILGLGYYLRNKNPDDTPVYTKIGIEYRILKYAFAGISLRTHWAKADFLGAGLGFRF